MSVAVGVLVALVAAAVATAHHFAAKYATTRPVLTAAEKSDRRKKLFPGCNGNILSVVIPCYNEAERLPPMLRDTIACLTQHLSRVADVSAGQGRRFFDAFEILVVDDCSTDATIKVAEAEFDVALKRDASLQKVASCRVVASKPNHGKGFVVRTGFFEAVGDFVLMADGDNATKIEDVFKLLDVVDGPISAHIAVGSRAHLEKDSVAQRTLFRTLLMIAFHWVVHVTYFVGTRGSWCRIRDTQCGFKLFRRAACESVFLSNRLERWAFDVELLLVARRQGLTATEVSVNWAEIPGSKVRLGGMVQMGLECLLMCATYSLGIWGVVRQ